MTPVDFSAPMGMFAHTIFHTKNYAHVKPSGHKEEWNEVANRVATSVLRPYFPALLPQVRTLIERRQFLPGGRYIYAAGRPFPQISNCFLFRAEDSRKGPNGWGKTMHKTTQSLMTGGGIGVVYSALRGEDSTIYGLGGRSTGPLALMCMVNEGARYIIQGGSRRSAVWAGLHWWHPDIFKFACMKDWSEDIRALKRKDFSFPAPMDGTNISVILDNDWRDAFSNPNWSKTYCFSAGSQNIYHTVGHQWAVDIYWTAVRNMLETAEPGLSLDFGDNDGESLRNACTEATSRDDSDNCNLSSLNLARFSTLQEFQEALPPAITFLLAGTLYGKLPLKRMYKVRENNRRIGLGLMGVHEWMIRRGFKYGSPECIRELTPWMEAYANTSNIANEIADRLGIIHPIAKRAIAPTGTISIIAETTSGIEPLFAAGYKRRYLEGKEWRAQYCVDVSAKRLVDEGVDPGAIEDAHTLSEDIERRIAFQAWMQQYVDQGISSTINLPEWGSSVNNQDTVHKFGTTLLPYLPSLRGLTCYPNGSRDGQPLVRTSYTEAIKHLGASFVDGSEDGCKNGTCGV